MLRPYKLGFRRNQAQPVNPLAPTLKNPCPSPDPRPGNTFTLPNQCCVLSVWPCFQDTDPSLTDTRIAVNLASSNRQILDVCKYTFCT